MTKADDHKLGVKGEKIAKKHLKGLGFKHLKSNYTTDVGEIDLIMQDDQTVVFVEVKTRSDESFATGASAINYGKQMRISKTAKMFIKKNALQSYPCRFDAVIVIFQDNKPNITHYPNAFPLR